jgi:hypothetical protein
MPATMAATRRRVSAAPATSSRFCADDMRVAIESPRVGIVGAQRLASGEQRQADAQAERCAMLRPTEALRTSLTTVRARIGECIQSR